MHSSNTSVTAWLALPPSPDLNLNPLQAAGLWLDVITTPPARAAMHHVVADDRRGDGLAAQVYRDFIARQHRRHGFGELSRREARVVPDDQPLGCTTGGPKVVGQTLRTACHVGKGEIVGDDAPPAVGAEYYGRGHKIILA